jgi:hypothetical protein
MQNYFSQFGKITRIHQQIELKYNKKYILGYYIEYENKSIAKRVALSGIY